MANYWQERVAAIAMALYENNETMTFNELAAELGHKPKLMGRRVGSAYKAMLDEERYEEASAIANAFTDGNGDYAY